MKRKILFLFFFFFAASVPLKTFATPEVGLIIGSPTGLNVEYQNFQGAVGWDIEKMFHFHLDYLFLKSTTGAFEFYLGGGGVFLSEDSSNQDNKETKKIFGPRVPLGATYLIQDVSMRVFFEVAPTLFLIEKVNFELQWGVGVRYVF